MPFLACLPLIEADIPAVLALDNRCLGGLWTQSGYQREIDSDCSDLFVLVSAPVRAPLKQRLQFTQNTQKAQRTSSLQQTSHQSSEQQSNRPSAQLSILGNSLAAVDPTLSISTPCSHPTATASPIQLLGVGCLWAILEEAHITTLAIEPSYQRQKLGSLMLSQLLLAGHRRGLHHATLEVRASNQQALRLYQKFDFKEAGQRPRYYSDGENARILWRSGLQQPNCITQLQNCQKAAIAHLEKTGKYQFFAEST